MSQKLKAYLLGVFSMYLIGAGLYGLIALQIPGFTVFGASYWGASWPYRLTCYAAEVECPYPPYAISQFMFDASAADLDLEH